MAVLMTWGSQNSLWGWHLVEGRDEVTDHNVLLAEVEHQGVHALMSLHMLRHSAHHVHTSLRCR